MNIVDISEIELWDFAPETDFNDLLAYLWKDGIKDVHVVYCTYEQKQQIAGFSAVSTHYREARKTPWPEAKHDFLVYESAMWGHIIVCPLDFALIDWAVNGEKGERPKMIYYNGSYKMSL
jgi:hypothetical protein